MVDCSTGGNIASLRASATPRRGRQTIAANRFAHLLGKIPKAVGCGSQQAPCVLAVARSPSRKRIGTRVVVGYGMGDAKRRKEEIERLKQAEAAWLAQLTPPERTAVEAARHTHTQLVQHKGTCRGMLPFAFVLNELLRSKYSIDPSRWASMVNHGKGDRLLPVLQQMRSLIQ